jgi:hypothetical protein
LQSDAIAAGTDIAPAHELAQQGDSGSRDPAAAQIGPTSFDDFLALFQQDGAAPAAVQDIGPAPVPATAPGVGAMVSPASFPVAAPPSQIARLPLSDAMPLVPHPGGVVGLPAVGQPGMLAGFTGIGSAATAGTPVSLEVESSQKYRRGQQGLLRVRTRGEAIDGDTVVELSAASALLASPFLGNTRIGPLETCEVAALRFIPRVAGSDQVRFTMTLKTAANVPIGRWTGSWVLNIEDAEKGPSAINAGGDVFIMGAMPMNPAVPGLDASLGMGIEAWQAVPLKADLAFNRRLANTCPEPEFLPPPLEPGPGWPVGARAQGAAQVRDAHTGLVQTLAVICGSSASFGRGGDSGVAWWLQPSPYDAHQHGRLSRRHVSLELRNGRVWATDWSTNGTWLNDERVTKSQPCLLAQDDRLEPAQAVPLQIRLLTCENRVHSVLILRNDALADRLCYLMTDGQVPIPMANPGQETPALWFAWRRTLATGAEMLACPAEGGPWAAIGNNQERVVAGRFRVRWSVLPSPTDQAAYLDEVQSTL